MKEIPSRVHVFTDESTYFTIISIGFEKPIPQIGETIVNKIRI